MSALVILMAYSIGLRKSVFGLEVLEQLIAIMESQETPEGICASCQLLCHEEVSGIPTAMTMVWQFGEILEPLGVR